MDRSENHGQQSHCTQSMSGSGEPWAALRNRRAAMGSHGPPCLASRRHKASLVGRRWQAASAVYVCNCCMAGQIVAGFCCVCMACLGHAARSL
jgi:hypothetical protein